MPKQRELEVRIDELKTKVKVLEQIRRINVEQEKLKSLRPARRKRSTRST